MQNMLINYISSGGFIGGVIFTVGLWFGVLRAYEMYTRKRSLLVFISLSTIVIPALTYVFFVINGQAKYAETQAMYGAIVGFLIPALYAEYVMNFEKQNKVQNIAPVQLVEKRKTAMPMSQLKPAEERKAVMPIARNQAPEERKTAMPTARLKAVEERKTVMQMTRPKVAEEHKIATQGSRPAPVEERKFVEPIARTRFSQERKAAEPISRSKAVENRNPTVPLSQRELGEVRIQARKNDVFYRNLRILLYVCLLLCVVLFPPYVENWTHDRAWVFITSANVRPLFTFDLTFLMYEFILLVVVFSGFEFWKAQS